MNTPTLIAHDYEEMLNSAKNAKENISELRKINKIVTCDILPTLDTYWQGDAKNLFLIKYNLVDASINQVLEKLEELIIDLERSGDRYRDGEIEALAFVNSWRR